MRETVHKWFWAWDFEKEEAWLNDMAAKGKALVSARYITYEFEDSQPGEYTIRLEMLDNLPSSPESQQYISFVESTGAEMVGKVLRWVYFRKKTAEGGFELHSDYAGRIKHLKGIITLLAVLVFVNLGNALNNISIGLNFPSCSFNLAVGILAASVSGLLGAGLYKLWRMKKRLEKEAQLYE